MHADYISIESPKCFKSSENDYPIQFKMYIQIIFRFLSKPKIFKFYKYFFFSSHFPDNAKISNIGMYVTFVIPVRMIQSNLWILLNFYVLSHSHFLYFEIRIRIIFVTSNFSICDFEWFYFCWPENAIAYLFIICHATINQGKVFLCFLFFGYDESKQKFHDALTKCLLPFIPKLRVINICI